MLLVFFALAPKELAPDGGKDENVFDIEQGVAISLFIKKKGLKKKIHHTDFWGTRIEKYKRSIEDDLRNINWNIIKASAPFYLFQPQNEELKVKYQNNFSVTEIFNLSSVGVVTSDDETLRGFEEKDVIKKVIKKYSIAEITKVKKLCSSPFDNRFIYYDKKLLERAREKIMVHLIQDNIALVCSKQVKAEFKHIFISDSITIFNFLDKAGSLGSGFIFPKFLYLGEMKVENINPSFKLFFEKKLNEFEYSDIFNYIYSILHSPSYRKKYFEFLKIDFPRIPFTEDKKIFQKLAVLGKQLIQVHLLNEATDSAYGDFVGKGNNIIEKTHYVIDKKVGKLYINKTQYFNNIPLELYNFYIGGYQVLDKYLKDRKGKELGLVEVENIKSTAGALAFTIEQMNKIDTLTKNWI